jgi:hypothetical protein
MYINSKKNYLKNWIILQNHILKQINNIFIKLIFCYVLFYTYNLLKYNQLNIYLLTINLGFEYKNIIRRKEKYG